MKRNIIGSYDSHTKEDLLNEVRLRELEGLTDASLKDEIVAKLEASDSIVPKYWKDDELNKPQ